MWRGRVGDQSVGRISRQLGDLDQGVFIIEFEGDMVPDAEAMQKAGIPERKVRETLRWGNEWSG